MSMDSAEAENVLKGTALSDPIVMWFAVDKLETNLIKYWHGTSQQVIPKVELSKGS